MGIKKTNLHHPQGSASDFILPTIYTIGHSNLEVYQFEQLLKQHAITRVVDVRTAPRSQYVTHFNREKLEFSLKQAGFNYSFMGETLGGRPNSPGCYFDREIPSGHADYLHLVDYETVMTKDFFQRGIDELMEMAVRDRLALMCSEEDPNTCHRHHMISKYLLREGYSVQHIRKDGSLVNAKQLPDLAKIESSKQLDLFG